MAKLLLRRAIAQRDIESSVSFYLAEAGADTALSFLAALEATMRHIAQRPAAGSPRYAKLLHLSELRVWPVRSYPYLIFYAEQDQHVDIWRVLHGSRDVAEFLRDDLD